MSKDGPVIIVNEDASSQKILFEVFHTLEYTNEIVFFYDIDKAFEYLQNGGTPPLLLLLEINLHSMDKLLLNLKFQKKSALQVIPYIFFSRTYDHTVVMHTSTSPNHGFFVMKNLDDTIESITVIMEYWKRSVSPFDFSF